MCLTSVRESEEEENTMYRVMAANLLLFCRAQREQHLKFQPPAGTRVRNEHGSQGGAPRPSGLSDVTPPRRRGAPGGKGQDAMSSGQS